MESGGDWVDFGGGGDSPQGCHSLAVFDQEDEGGEAGLDGEDWDGG